MSIDLQHSQWAGILGGPHLFPIKKRGGICKVFGEVLEQSHDLTLTSVFIPASVPHSTPQRAQ